MAKITFILVNGTHIEAEAPAGYSVMEIAQLNNIEGIEGTCGGCMACATCHVHVHPDWWDKCLPDGARSDEEEDMLDLAFDVNNLSRLSCQILMSEDLDGLILALPGANIKGWLKAA